jgi:hypothetical protein
MVKSHSSISHRAPSSHTCRQSSHIYLLRRQLAR